MPNRDTRPSKIDLSQLNNDQSTSHIRVFPVGSVIATFFTETCVLPAPVSPSPSDNDASTSEDEEEEENDHHGMQEDIALSRGTVAELCAYIVRVVLATLPGGHLVGNNTKQFAIVWSAATVTTLLSAISREYPSGSPEGTSASRFAWEIRGTLHRIGAEYLEGDGLWIRCDDHEALRCCVALEDTAAGNAPVTVIVPHAAAHQPQSTHLHGVEDEIPHQMFELLPCQNVLWNAFTAPQPVARAHRIGAVVLSWAPWTVDVVLWEERCDAQTSVAGLRPSSSASPLNTPSSIHSPAVCTPEGGHHGMLRVGSAVANPVSPVTANSGHFGTTPASPGMSRIPSRAFSVEMLDAVDSPHTPPSSTLHKGPRTRSARLSRTTLRCETHGSSSVLLVRIECPYTDELAAVLATSSSPRQRVANAQRLTSLYHILFQAASRVMGEHGGTISCISVLLQPQPPHDSVGVVSSEVVFSVELVCVLPRIELSRQITHFSSLCAEVAVCLVDAAVAGVADWCHDVFNAEPTVITAKEEEAEERVATTGKGRGMGQHCGGGAPPPPFTVSSCLMQGRLLHSPCHTGSTLIHRSEVDVVGGYVVERGRTLIRLALSAMSTAGSTAGPPRDGIQAICIGDPSHSPNSESRPEKGHVPFCHISPSLTTVVEGATAPQALTYQHRRLAKSLLQLKLRTSGLRILVGAQRAWTTVGGMVGQLLNASTASKAKPSRIPICLVWGPCQCGKTSFLLDCLIHLSVLPTVVFLDGASCRGSASASFHRGIDRHHALPSSSVGHSPMLFLLHLELAAALTSTSTAPRQPPSTQVDLLERVREQFLQLQQRTEPDRAGILVVVMDDLHKVVHDTQSFSLLHQLSLETGLLVAVIAASADPHPLALRGHGDACSVTSVPLDTMPLGIGDDGLSNVLLVLRQFASLAVLGEAIQYHGATSPETPFSLLHRLLRCMRDACCGSLVAMASLGHELKDRTTLLALTSASVVEADHLYEGSGDDVILSANDLDHLMTSRMEDFLVADVSNTFHHALCEHISTLQPLEAAWLAALACYCAAAGNSQQGVDVAICRELYRIAVTDAYHTVAPVAGCSDNGPDELSGRSDSHTISNNSFLVDDHPSEHGEELFSFDNRILRCLTIMSACDGDSCEAFSDGSVSASSRMSGLRNLVFVRGAVAYLRPIFIPRVVVRLMRADVITETCRRMVATQESWFHAQPAHVRCWLACMQDSGLSVVDANLERDTRTALAQGGVAASHICQTLRRHGFHSAGHAPCSLGQNEAPSLQAPHRIVTQDVQLAQIASSSLMYDRVLGVYAASERSRRRIRRTGHSTGGLAGMVTIVTRHHDVDVALEHLRYAWRSFDAAVVKQMQRSSHTNQRGGEAMELPTSSFHTPMSVAGGMPQWGATARGSAAVAEAEMAAIKAVADEVAESKARLEAVWALCKRLSSFVEQHPAAVDTHNPRLRAAVLESDRLIQQAIGGSGAPALTDEPSDRATARVGEWRAGYQELCAALAQCCGELSETSTKLSAVHIKRLQSNIDAAVCCTALHELCTDMVCHLQLLNNERCRIANMTDVTKAAQEQMVETIIAGRVHATLHSVTRLLLLILSLTTLSPSLPTSESGRGRGHAHVDPSRCHRQRPTLEERVLERFLVEVAHRYLSTMCALDDHVNSSRAGLVRDYCETVLALLTTFATVTVDACATQQIVSTVGDVRKENTIHLTTSIRQNELNQDCMWSATNDRWHLVIPTVAPRAAAATATPTPTLTRTSAAWRPSGGARANRIARPPPPD